MRAGWREVWSAQAVWPCGLSALPRPSTWESFMYLHFPFTDNKIPVVVLSSSEGAITLLVAAPKAQIPRYGGGGAGLIEYIFGSTVDTTP